MRLRVAWIGKTRNPVVREWTDEYLLRIRRFAQITGEELTEKQGEAGLVKRAAGTRLVLLDPAGKAFNSEGFARFLERQFQHDTREMVFGVGGAEGFGKVARAAAETTISLSSMTFSHELARIVLLEQIYRACALLNNHPYPK
jgi:23S rRNA (pseudouridine1915-N3)-methyltransferase